MAIDLDLLRRSILQVLKETGRGMTHRKIWSEVGAVTYTPGQVEEMLFKLVGDKLLGTYRAGGQEYWTLIENRQVIGLEVKPTKTEMIAAMLEIMRYADNGTPIHPGSEVLEPIKDILKRFGVRE